MKNLIGKCTLWMTAFALCVLVFGTAVQAQEDVGQGQLNRERARDGALDQNRAGEQDQDRDRDRDNWRNQLHSRIDAATDLTAEEQAAMHANLNACFDLGIDETSVEAVFPGEGKRNRVSAQAMLRLQNRVMTAAREGLPVEPMLIKIQEGRTKGVAEPLLERACVRMEQNVRTAHRIMQKAQDEGFEPPKDGTQTRRMNGEMAQQMWRGMNEEGYEQIRERARLRLRDGDCGVEDLVAGGEVATRLLEAGVNRERATRFAGEALQQGYRTQQMHQLQVMVASRYQRGEPMDAFVGDMEQCLGAGMGAGEMYNYMMRHGWMGPGDMYGPGGYQPTDHKGLGGDKGDGGMGGQGDHKGTGGTGGHQGGQ
jgi:hypothetical protein